ncbi:MAG: hypothetical protein Q9198_010662 [Flavoplaca austrocitrina]
MRDITPINGRQVVASIEISQVTEQSSTPYGRQGQPSSESLESTDQSRKRGSDDGDQDTQKIVTPKRRHVSPPVRQGRYARIPPLNLLFHQRPLLTQQKKLPICFKPHALQNLSSSPNYQSVPQKPSAPGTETNHEPSKKWNTPLQIAKHHLMSDHLPKMYTPRSSL